MGICVFISEICLKPVFKQPRPVESANRYPDGSPKYGMPSGHCLCVCAIMSWLLGEMVSDFDEIDQRYLCGVVLLLAPVPWSRWHNMDHTLSQCIVGSLLGLCVGLLAFAIRHNYYHGHAFPWELTPQRLKQDH